jgi:hypothetical protein
MKVEAPMTPLPEFVYAPIKNSKEWDRTKKGRTIGGDQGVIEKYKVIYGEGDDIVLQKVWHSDWVTAETFDAELKKASEVDSTAVRKGNNITYTGKIVSRSPLTMVRHALKNTVNIPLIIL